MMVTIDFFFPAMVSARHLAILEGSISFFSTRELHLSTIDVNVEEDSMSIDAKEVAACFHVFLCRAKKSNFIYNLFQSRFVSERQ
jgi:hypothetical protein